MLKELKKNRCYLVVNCDEPYAEKVFKLIRDNEIKKGTWEGSNLFSEFFKSTFGFNLEFYKAYLKKIKKIK